MILIWYGYLCLKAKLEFAYLDITIMEQGINSPFLQASRTQLISANNLPSLSSQMSSVSLFLSERLMSGSSSGG